jgi:hypothetical protein
MDAIPGIPVHNIEYLKISASEKQMRGVLNKLGKAALLLAMPFVIGSNPSAEYLKRRRISETYNKPLQKVIELVKTPEQAQEYCSKYLRYADDFDTYHSFDYWASFESTHRKRKGDCEDAAIAAYVLLEDEYIPYLILLKTGKKYHIVCAYQDMSGKWGAVSIGESEFRPPEYTFESLIKSFRDYDYCGIVSLSGDMVRGKNNLLEGQTAGSR